VPRHGPGNRVPVGMYENFRNRKIGGIADITGVFDRHPFLLPNFVTTEKELAKSLVDDNSQAIYLFCHGDFGPGPGGRISQQLHLRDNFAVTSGWLETKLHGKLSAAQFSTPPIVLLNACQGGVFGEGGSNTVADTLRRYGVQTTIAPLVNIPVCFASEFGTELLRVLVQGSFVGDALLQTTRTFAEDQNNLLGLTYATVNGRNRQIRNPH
jgi:hypothetical protein